MITAHQPRQSITHEGHRIAYLAAGDPTHPALLFVHGWLSHAGFWRDSLNWLSERFYCVAVDLLGFGHSDKPPQGDYTIPAQSGRIIALADALGLTTFTLIGHSMGGQISLYTARQHPQRVTRMILIGSVVDAQLTPYLKRVYRSPLTIGYYLPATWVASRFFMSRWKAYKYRFLDDAMTYRRDAIPLDSPDIPMATLRGVERPAYLAFYAIQACIRPPRSRPSGDPAPNRMRRHAPRVVILRAKHSGL